MEEVKDVDPFYPLAGEITILRHIPEWRIHRVQSVHPSEVESMIKSQISTPSFKKPTNKSSNKNSASKNSPAGKSGKQSARTKITGFSMETI